MKKIFSLLLSFTMVFTLFTVTISAEDSVTTSAIGVGNTTVSINYNVDDNWVPFTLPEDGRYVIKLTTGCSGASLGLYTDKDTSSDSFNKFYDDNSCPYFFIKGDKGDTVYIDCSIYSQEETTENFTFNVTKTHDGEHTLVVDTNSGYNARFDGYTSNQVTLKCTDGDCPYTVCYSIGVKDVLLSTTLTKVPDYSFNWNMMVSSDTGDIPKEYYNMVEGTDYTISCDRSKQGWQTGTLKILKHTGYIGESILFKIYVRYNLTKKTATLSYTTCQYSNSAKKPTVTIKGLTKGTDYKVTYSNNTNIGKATVKIVGIGKYSGTITKTFTIKPKTPAVKTLVSMTKKLSVWAAKTVSLTGGTTYQIAYKQKGTSTWKYVTTQNQNYVIKSLKSGKRYYVKIRAYKYVNGTRYNSAWSATKLSSKIK